MYTPCQHSRVLHHQKGEPDTHRNAQWQFSHKVSTACECVHTLSSLTAKSSTSHWCYGQSTVSLKDDIQHWSLTVIHNQHKLAGTSGLWHTNVHSHTLQPALLHPPRHHLAAGRCCCGDAAGTSGYRPISCPVPDTVRLDTVVNHTVVSTPTDHGSSPVGTFVLVLLLPPAGSTLVALLPLLLVVLVLLLVLLPLPDGCTSVTVAPVDKGSAAPGPPDSLLPATCVAPVAAAPLLGCCLGVVTTGAGTATAAAGCGTAVAGLGTAAAGPGPDPAAPWPSIEPGMVDTVAAGDSTSSGCVGADSAASPAVPTPGLLVRLPAAGVVEARSVEGAAAGDGLVTTSGEG
jgi:hypothetical protein